MIRCECLPKQSWFKTFWSGPPRSDYCPVTGRTIRNFPVSLSMGCTTSAEVEYEEQIWLHGMDEPRENWISA